VQQPADRGLTFLALPSERDVMVIRTRAVRRTLPAYFSRPSAVHQKSRASRHVALFLCHGSFVLIDGGASTAR
jgi:hypothetical protein